MQHTGSVLVVATSMVASSDILFAPASPAAIFVPDRKLDWAAAAPRKAMPRPDEMLSHDAVPENRTSRGTAGPGDVSRAVSCVCPLAASSNGYWKIWLIRKSANRRRPARSDRAGA